MPAAISSTPTSRRASRWVANSARPPASAVRPSAVTPADRSLPLAATLSVFGASPTVAVAQGRPAAAQAMTPPSRAIRTVMVSSRREARGAPPAALRRHRVAAGLRSSQLPHSPRTLSHRRPHRAGDRDRLQHGHRLVPAFLVLRGRIGVGHDARRRPARKPRRRASARCGSRSRCRRRRRSPGSRRCRRTGRGGSARSPR